MKTKITISIFCYFFSLNLAAQESDSIKTFDSVDIIVNRHNIQRIDKIDVNDNCLYDKVEPYDIRNSFNMIKRASIGLIISILLTFWAIRNRKTLIK